MIQSRIQFVAADVELTQWFTNGRPNTVQAYDTIIEVFNVRTYTACLRTI